MATKKPLYRTTALIGALGGGAIALFAINNSGIPWAGDGNAYNGGRLMGGAGTGAVIGLAGAAAADLIAAIVGKLRKN